MARIVHVGDPADPRLADYTRLKDVNLRRSLEAERGLFIAEGEKVIRRAAAAGYPLRSLLLTRGRAAALADIVETAPGNRATITSAARTGPEPAPGTGLEPGPGTGLEPGPGTGLEPAPGTGPGPAARTGPEPSRVIGPETAPRTGPGSAAGAGPAPVYLVPDDVAERLTGFDVHRGALACFGRLPLPPTGELIEAASRVVVLEDLADAGNVGAVFRCAAALGIDAVILSPRCADPLYRRAVKVSMGAVFSVGYSRLTGWYRGLDEIREAGFRLLALTPDQSAAPIGAMPMTGKVALVLGGEGDGLSPRWLRTADRAVCIPMSGEAMDRGVDSLNVVAAAAIACQELARGGRRRG